MVIKNGLIFFVVSFFLCSHTHGELGNSIAAIVGDIDNQTLSNIRIIRFRSKNIPNTSTLINLNKRIQLANCGKKRIRVVDAKGKIFEVDVVSKVMTSMFDTNLSFNEDVHGKTIFNPKDNSVIYVVNKYSPDRLSSLRKKTSGSFILESVNKAGAASPLLKREGSVLFLWKLSKNTIELITKGKIIQYNEKSKKTTEISYINPQGISDIHLFKDGYSFYGRRYGLEVKIGLFGKSVTKVKIHEGFGIIYDFNSITKTFLFIVVDKNKSHLYEMNLHDSYPNILHSFPFIGGACYFE